MINRGFLCIGAATCLCSVMQNCSAQINTEQDFKRLIFEKCWDAWASKIVKNVNLNGWYKNALYNRSIYEQMATAIADCMTLKNEFAPGRTCQGFVEFGVTPFNANYERKHWNALVLYNYLYAALRNNNVWLNAYGVQYVGELLKGRYRSVPNAAQQINNAVSDIQRYAHSLGLYDFLYRLGTWKNAVNKFHIQDCLNIGYTVGEDHLFDPSTKSAAFCIWDAIVGVDGKSIRTIVNVKIQEGEVVEYQTPYGIFTTMTSDMKLFNKRVEKPTHGIRYNDLTKSAQAQDIHSLNNLYTCHIDSLITALSMSDLFRQAIKKVSLMSEKTVQIGSRTISLTLCKQIQKMINGIDDGSMSRGGGKDSEQKYRQLHGELMQALATTNAVMRWNKEKFTSVHNMNVNDMPNDWTFWTLVNAELKESVMATGYTSMGLACRNVMRAIAYEFERYGIRDVLKADWLEQMKYEKTVFQKGEDRCQEVPVCFENNKELEEETKNNISVKELITKNIREQGARVTGVWIKTSDGREIDNEVKVADKAIRVLPNVLCVITPRGGSQDYDIKLDDTFEIQDTQGKKRYRLVSEVMRTSSHFIARIKLKDGFYIVDDNEPYFPCAVKEKDYFEYYVGYMSRIEGFENRRDIHIAIYERCD